MEQFDPSTSFRNLKAFLLLRGSSLVEIAQKHGFKACNLQQAARQYWGTDRQPRAILTDKMLTALRQEVSELRGKHEIQSDHAA